MDASLIVSDDCTKYQAYAVLTVSCWLQTCDVRMHFLSITEVFPPKLKTDEKKQALTLQRVDEYNQCILDSHMLLPAGPFGLVDMHHLTRGMRSAALRCTSALAHLFFGLYACDVGICDTVAAHQMCCHCQEHFMPPADVGATQLALV